jgi:hypothetical protein
LKLVLRDRLKGVISSLEPFFSPSPFTKHLSGIPIQWQHPSDPNLTKVPGRDEDLAPILTYTL